MVLALYRTEAGRCACWQGALAGKVRLLARCACWQGALAGKVRLLARCACWQGALRQHSPSGQVHVKLSSTAVQVAPVTTQGFNLGSHGSILVCKAVGEYSWLGATHTRAGCTAQTCRPGLSTMQATASISGETHAHTHASVPPSTVRSNVPVYHKASCLASPRQPAAWHPQGSPASLLPHLTGLSRPACSALARKLGSPAAFPSILANRLASVVNTHIFLHSRVGG